MNSTTPLHLFLVDDDAVYLRLLQIEFEQKEGYRIHPFSTGEACLNSLSLHPDIIILDYQLDGVTKNALNGIEVLDKIKKHHPHIPVVMLSVQDSIDVAISSMHHQATDYVVKSETAFIRLLQIIQNIVSKQQLENTVNWYMERM